MGAWSEETFGNDSACDWIGGFVENPGLAAIREAVDAVLYCDDYLDSGEACDCLAACEVIARLQGRWGVRDSYSEDLDRWVEAHPMSVPEDLKDAADLAIEKILGSNSELRELWDDGGRNEKWHAAINNLRERLKDQP